MAEPATEPTPTEPEPTVTPPAEPAAEVPPSPTFLEGLPSEITDHPTMEKFSSLEALAKSYINLEGMKGDSMRIPHRDAAPEEWGEVFDKLGRPATAADYALPDVDMVEGVERDEAMETAFKEHAHNIGLSQDQVAELSNWYNGAVNETAVQMAQQFQANQTGAEDLLRKEWGQEYDQKMRQIGWAVNAFADDEAFEALEEGWGNDPRLARMLSAVGAAMTEDSVRELTGTTPSDRFGISPSEAQSEIATMMGDSKHAYWDKKSPAHEQAVGRMAQLQQVVHGNEPVNPT